MDRYTFSCKTKYPILLVHGTGARDDRRRNCWGRIPSALTKAGAEVFYGNQDAWATIEENAETLKDSILSILNTSQSEKINIIAISKGGLETRYMIHKFDMGEKVASLTTISTPHYGSKTMDFFCGKMDSLLKFAAVFINASYRLQGDKNPDFYNTCQQFTTTYSERFNREVKDSGKVYYQSYASLMKKPYNDMLLSIPHSVVKYFDGECDGIVSIDSAKWGEYKGLIKGGPLRGVSHSDLRDKRKMGPSGKKIVRAYINIVSELTEKGL